MVTTDEVSFDSGDTAAGGFDGSDLAAAYPVSEPDSVVRTVVVVLNLTLLERFGADLKMRAADIDQDIDRILIHEIYAQALPRLVEAPDAPTRCPASACMRPARSGGKTKSGPRPGWESGPITAWKA
ncbi:MAG: hypothetical protein L0271_04290 [Gemmatimonadetes bacterium]|nr:hypothetical protein [Gemmatimonadota bacterium]